MSTSLENLWTIDELGARVALALSVDYEGQSSGRVRGVPDRRTIRYYTTLGLIDRPAEMRGRTALYGRRHLLQLVAIKRLQARGLSLAELQQRLLGRSNAALAKLARLPAEGEAPAGDAGNGAVSSAPRSEEFWKVPPPPLTPGEAASSSPPAGQPEGAAVGTAQEQVIALQGIRLDGGVTLFLPSARPVEADDLEAIRAVAAPLLELLEKRRLLRPTQERRNA